MSNDFEWQSKRRDHRSGGHCDLRQVALTQGDGSELPWQGQTRPEDDWDDAYTKMTRQPRCGDDDGPLRHARNRHTVPYGSGAHQARSSGWIAVPI
jgi:hypothetical protein